MAGISTILQGVSYKKYITEGDDLYVYVNPYDVSGNLISQITIEIENEENDVFILLPVIGVPKSTSEYPETFSLNGNYNCNIRIIRLVNSSGNIRVNANLGLTEADSISGSDRFFFNTEDGFNENISLTPISAGNWSIITSLNIMPS